MTPEQINNLKIQAEKDAAELRLLLLTAKSGVTWESDTGRWRVNGRIVSIDSVRSYLLRIESKFGRQIVNLIDALEKEQITLAAWEREFDRTISSAHILAGAFAVGGIAAAVANADIETRIESEVQFADEFVSEIRKKKAGSFRALKSRAKSYYRAATITYSQTEQKVRGLIGIQTEARRILRAAEDCPWCLKFADRWILIDEMPPIGGFDPAKYPKGCGRFCRCYLIYR